MPRLKPDMSPKKVVEHRLRQLMARMGGKKPLSSTEIREQFKVIQAYAKMHGQDLPSGIVNEGTEFNPRPVEMPSAVASPASELSVKFGDELEEKNGEKENDSFIV